MFSKRWKATLIAPDLLFLAACGGGGGDGGVSVVPSGRYT